MFENIICQDQIVASLTSDLAAGTLPSALLLWGPDFSGKLSVALELARVLSCEEEAVWGCGCKACAAQRLLTHPHTILIGGRYFYEEACACAEVLRKTGALPARYLFVRAVRKLLRRFDAFLWEDREADLRKIAPAFAAAQEAVDSLLPGEGLSAEKTAELAASAREAVKKICEAVNLDAIRIDLLRRASAWTHVGASGAQKILIIENADRMREEARNSLLKILEEPPAHVRFILTTTRRAAILPTMLSRLRTYRFLPRGEEADRQVLAKIFREDYPMGSLRDFFRSSRGASPAALSSRARDFLTKAASRAEAFSAFLARDDSFFTDKTLFRIFLEELTRTLSSALYGEEKFPAVSLRKLEEWMTLVRRTQESLEVLNIAPPLLAQRLYTVMGKP